MKRRSFLGLLAFLAFAPAFSAPATAQTASPNLNDQQVLASDPTFQNRVRQSLVAACIAIANEATSTGFHFKRVNYCAAVMAAPDSFKTIFADAVSTGSTVINDATQTGTVPLTSTNVAAQAAKVLDADLNTELSAVFNSFLSVP